MGNPSWLLSTGQFTSVGGFSPQVVRIWARGNQRIWPRHSSFFQEVNASFVFRTDWALPCRAGIQGISRPQGGPPGWKEAIRASYRSSSRYREAISSISHVTRGCYLVTQVPTTESIAFIKSTSIYSKKYQDNKSATTNELSSRRKRIHFTTS